MCHIANRRFWTWCRAEWPQRFQHSSVTEFGSYNINGSVREFFEACDYIGIDWRKGPGVDLVCLAHEAPTIPCNVVVSASMLEHDPYWEKSLARMCQVLRPAGMMFLTWGSACNGPHHLPEAPDGLFHALAVGRVVETLVANGVSVVMFCYETRFGGTNGEACLVGFKGEWVGPNYESDRLLPEDR